MSYPVDPALHFASLTLARREDCTDICGSPDEEVKGMDEERRHHPLGSQQRPQGVVLLPQEEEGAQVSQNIGQAQDYIKKCKL